MTVALTLLAGAGAQAAPGDPPAGADAACALPDALSKAKEDKAARKAYVAVLASDPSSACAMEGLTALNTPAPKSASSDCALGQAYLDADRDDDAIGAFKKGLEKDPDAGCAAEGLDEAGPSWITRATDDVIGAIPAVLVILGLLLLAFLLFLLLGYWPPLKRYMRRPPVIGALISNILSPRLTFEAIADDAVAGKPGATIVARIKMLLGRMREEALSEDAPEYDLDLGTPREEFADLVSADTSLKNSLDNASDISDQTKIVAALLNLAYSLLPIQRFEISGSLEPPAASGAAAALILEEDAKLRAATTVRGSAPTGESPTAPDYMHLAEPAAVWIQYEVARAIEGKTPDSGAADSQALVYEGLGHYARDDLGAARAAYEKALRVDRRNWAAYVCLAVAEARSGENFGRSIEKTGEGLKAMRGETDR